MRGRRGDVLQAEGRISREQAEWPAEVAARDGARIGSVLVAAGLVRRGELYRVLARMWDCPYVDLTDAVTHPHELAAEGWFPLRYEAAGRHGGATVLVATCEEPTDELAARIERQLGSPVTLHVTTDWDIGQALHVGFRETVIEQATLGLWRRDRAQSARTVLFPGQKVLFTLAALALLTGLATARAPR